MIKTFHPTPTKTWKPKGIRNLNTVPEIPTVDCSQFDEICRAAWMEGYVCYKTEDGRVPESIRAGGIAHMNLTFGRRAWT